IAGVVPVTLAAKLRRSHFLFLGYFLDDWSLRVFLHRIWGRDRVSYRSWAVVPGADRVERELWRQRGIDSMDVPMADFVHSFRRYLGAVAGCAGRARSRGWRRSKPGTPTHASSSGASASARSSSPTCSPRD